MALLNHYITTDGADSGDLDQNLYNASTDGWASSCSLRVALACAIAADVVLLRNGTRAGVVAAYSRYGTLDTPANPGNATSPIVFQGCDSSGNVITPTRSYPGGPLDTSQFPQITYTTGYFTAKGYSFCRGLSFSGTTNGGVWRDASYAILFGCRVENTGTGSSARAVSTANTSFVVDNDLYLTSASGGSSALYISTSARAVGNRILSTGASAKPAIYLLGSGLPIAVGNLCVSELGHPIRIASTIGALLIMANTCVDSSGSVDGIHFDTGNVGVNLVIGNQITDNGRYGIAADDAACGLFAAWNRLTRNVSANLSGATDWLAATCFGHVTTAQAGADNAAQRLNEYSSPGSANYDYRLKTASYAKKAGLWLCDIGALQRQENTYPAAAKVFGGPGEGTFGDVLQPTTPTLRASNLHSGAGAPGVDLAADSLASGVTVDDVAGTLAASGGTPVFGGMAQRRA